MIKKHSMLKSSLSCQGIGGYEMRDDIPKSLVLEVLQECSDAGEAV